MSRIKIDDRKLPGYSREEEIFNMVSHIVGGGFGVIVFGLCIGFSIYLKNWAGLISGGFYGLMMIFLYTMSSVYHGLKEEHGKKVMQVIDHCTIFALIDGSYAPVLATGLWKYSHKITLAVSVVVFIGTAIGVTFTAIDFHSYKYISYSSYFVIGWAVIFAIVPLIHAYNPEFFLWLLAGGISYTSGMAFYAKGGKKKFAHSIFHLFILLGSILQFVGIFKFCILQY